LNEFGKFVDLLDLERNIVFDTCIVSFNKKGSLEGAIVFKCDADERITNVHSFSYYQANQKPFNASSLVTTTKHFYFFDDNIKLIARLPRNQNLLNAEAISFSLRDDLPYYYVTYLEKWGSDLVVDIIDKKNKNVTSTETLKNLASSRRFASIILAPPPVVHVAAMFNESFENVWKSAIKTKDRLPTQYILMGLIDLAALILLLFRCRERNFNATLTVFWTLWILLFGLAGFLAHLCVYPRLTKTECCFCRKATRVDVETCQHCRKPFPAPSFDGTEILSV
jgi:hypothetical protein